MKTLMMVAIVAMLTACGEEQAAAPATAEEKKSEEKPAKTVENQETGKVDTVDTDPTDGDGTNVPTPGATDVALKLTSADCVDPDLAKLHKAVKLMLCDGTMAEGTYEPPTIVPPPDLTGLISENIKSGVVINGVTGSYAGAAQPDLTNLAAGNVKQGVTIAGVTGTFNGPSHDLTNLVPANIKQGIVIDGVTGSYSGASHDLANLLAGNIKSGVTIDGVTGSYDNRPADCNGNGQTGCVATSSFKSADLTNLSAANVKDGVTIAGVAGIYDNTPVTCTSNGQTGCVTDSTYKAANLTNLTAGNIKSGVAIAGVTGQFPSATYKLSGADNTADLTDGTFDAKLKSATAFEWFDAEGTRYTYQGDADLNLASNIKDGVTIFGQLGTLTTVTAPNTWDLRNGTVVGAVTGSAKMTCRQRSGLAAAADKCVGESYVDITGNGQNCTSSPATCMYTDKISGLTFAKTGGQKTWANADSYCSTLTVDGVSGWRLPEREELQRMFIQGISFTTSLIVDGTIGYWSSTAGTTGKYAVRIMDNGATTDTAATSATPGTLCVK